LAALSATLHYAHKKKKLAAVPSIPTLEVPESEFTVLTQEKAVKLLAELPPHLNAMMRFSLATGLREANVRELRWSQVNLSERVAWIWARKAKARKMIGVPLNDTAIEVLQGELGRHPECVFTFAKIGKEGKVLGRRPIARKASNSSWYKALKRAGLEGLRWHDLRRAWATWHARAGTPMLAIQAMGGWATSSMVQRYTHLAGQNLHAEAAAIRVPNVSPRMLDARFPSRSNAESADAPLDIPVFIGVDDGIRTRNNRNHNRAPANLRA